jgi:hypothetical protein
MAFGIQHTILYPQDKKRNYSFPNDGAIASEAIVDSKIASELGRTVTKANIEDLLGFKTSFVELLSLFRSSNDTLKDVTDLSFAVSAGNMRIFRRFMIVIGMRGLSSLPFRPMISGKSWVLMPKCGTFAR